MGRPPRDAPGGIGVWPLSLLVCVAVAFGATLVLAPPGDASAAGPPTPAPQATLPVPGKPSIPQGEAVFGSRCAGCHHDRSRFAAPAWRDGITPARVARVALGEAAGHPAVVSALEVAWQVTGYLWTLPTDGTDIRRGESLALQADDLLRADALGTLLFHWGAVQNLKSATWVLNHRETDVDRLMRELAGPRYTALPPEDQQDLIDYTFASFFVWPPSW